MLETIRAFVAVNLEITAIRRLVALQRGLRSSPEAPPIRIAWVAPPNIHITLRAFDPIDRALAPALGDRLREILTNTPPLRVQLDALDAFPRQDHARLLIVDAKDSSGSLDELVRNVDALAQEVGFPAQPNPFRAHLTIARIPEPTNVTRWFASLGRYDLSEAQLTECVLYGGAGESPAAEHVALERIGLGSPSGGRSHRPRSRNPSQRPKSRSKPPPSGRSPTADAIPPPPRLPDLPSPGEPDKSS